MSARGPGRTRPARSRRTDGPVPDAAGGTMPPAAWLLWSALAATLAARALAALLPGRALWGRDLWLHWALPRTLAARAGWPAERTNRLLGAALALANGVLAWRLARVRHANGAVALAIAAIAGWSATLALFSGYAKGLVEVAVLA